MRSGPGKILYIAGAGRSGSTLLSRILGQLEGFVSPGELYFLWQERFAEERKCECGERLERCTFWTDVLGEIGRRVGPIDPPEVLKRHQEVARTRHAPLWLLPGLRRLLSLDPAYAELLRALYESLASVARADVIVDASKMPSYGLVLREVLQADFRVVHLVRDPRAVAHSWRRKRYNPATDAQFGRIPLKKSALLWDVWNVMVERTSSGPSAVPYLRVRYEDFTSRPVETLRQILAFVDEDRDVETVLGDGWVRLDGAHSVGGNPNRFRNGLIPLRADQDWVAALGTWPLLTVSALTLPLLVRYGYSIRRPSRSETELSNPRPANRAG